MRRAGTELTPRETSDTSPIAKPGYSFVRTLYGRIFYESPSDAEAIHMYYVKRCKILLPPSPDGMTVFQMCSARGDKKRPKICSILKPGGKRCRDIRRNAGL